ncbi:MAG: hypothetical protein Q7K55_02690 [Candidatus Levybacteria bacterium]|nr:hypothetical protein [Candidatus Levybacteria bacterium]
MRIIFNLFVGIFFTFLSFFVMNLMSTGKCCDQITGGGLPLSFYQTGGFMGRTTFSLPLLVLDIVFWLVISFILFSFLFKGKKKRYIKPLLLIFMFLDIILIFYFRKFLP